MKECKAVKINQIMKTSSAIWAENWKQKKTDEVHIFKAFSPEDDRARQKREKEEDRVRERAFKIAHRFAKGQLN